MYSYHLYGLNVESEVELLGVMPSNNKTDVIILIDKIKNKPAIAEKKFLAHWSTKEEVCISYKDIATFLVRNGQEIIIEPEENKDLKAIGQILLGVAISVILFQRGFLVLHSSLIEINGYAVGFLGHSGNGKSSLATALYEHGHRLVSDDLCVVDFDGSDQIFAYPGFPQFKLWPDMIDTIGINPDDLPQVSTLYSKRTRVLTKRFVKSIKVPLQLLYVLDQGSEIEITDIKGYQSIIELVSLTFDINLIERTNGLVKHFTQCSQVANAVTIRRLKRPWSLDRMPDVIEAIEKDVLTA